MSDRMKTNDGFGGLELQLKAPVRGQPRLDLVFDEESEEFKRIAAEAAVEYFRGFDAVTKEPISVDARYYSSPESRKINWEVKIIYDRPDAKGLEGAIADVYTDLEGNVISVSKREFI